MAATTARMSCQLVRVLPEYATPATCRDIHTALQSGEKAIFQQMKVYIVAFHAPMPYPLRFSYKARYSHHASKSNRLCLSPRGVAHVKNCLQLMEKRLPEDRDREYDYSKREPVVKKAKREIKIVKHLEDGFNLIGQHFRMCEIEKRIAANMAKKGLPVSQHSTFTPISVRRRIMA
ncbi:unnamed protein product [Calypogeia fissa]